MIWGKPDEISTEKVDLYKNYAFAKESDEKFATKDIDDYFGVEQLVKEFVTLKQVLINNAIPVDLA